jgi:hypothetical protein
MYDDIVITPANDKIANKLDIIIKSPKFQKWVKNIDREDIDISEIIVTDVDWHCEEDSIMPEKLRSVKIIAKAIDRNTGLPIPEMLIIRGPSVAVLIRVDILDTPESYFLMCDQMRLPVGGKRVEAPSGFLDANDNIFGATIKSIRNSTGLILPNASRLISLGDVDPLPSLCDESIQLFAWTTEMTLERFEEIRNRERLFYNKKTVNIQFIPANNMDIMSATLNTIGDIKMECAYRRFMWLTSKKSGGDKSKILFETDTQTHDSHDKMDKYWEILMWSSLTFLVTCLFKNLLY